MMVQGKLFVGEPTKAERNKNAIYVLVLRCDLGPC